MPSKPTFAALPPMNAARRGSGAQNLSSTTCVSGSKPSLPPSPASRPSPGRSATHSRAGKVLYQFAECLTLQGFPNHSQNDSTWQTEGFAMGQAIAVRRDFTSEEVRQLAKRAKDSSQARRLLAIAEVLDGASRQDAAKAAGMDRQTLRDWVIRFNEKGANGLVNIPSPGAPPKLDDRHKAFLARIVEEGPMPAVAWRGALAGLRSDHAIARGVWAFGIGRHGLPRLEGIGLLACERQAQGVQATPTPWTRSKKLCRTRGGNPRGPRAWHTGRSVVPGRDAGPPEEQTHLSLGPDRFTPPGRSRSSHPIDLF